ncbi:ABC transporter ATP-binding protein [Thermoleophilia bacterium SCSIO 60948]|nr:ABC transporter ATP-binding protein [Thermoleophilia bacterium SCSIO 60948]
MAAPLLSVKDLRVSFRTEDGIVQAVDDVSFDLAPGEVLAVVGESGSGKSVTAMSMLGLTRSRNAKIEGSAEFGDLDLINASDEELRSLRGNDVSMIFQDPMTSMNPVYKVGDQIVEAIRAHRDMGKKEAWERAVELLETVGIPAARERADAFPHQFSGGMRQRAMIAMALSLEPKLLIADEPTTALDVTIQAQILKLLKQLNEERGLAVILITHDLGVVADIADRVMVMYAGQVVEQGTLDQIFYDPQHPYTWGLLGSITRLDRDRSDRLAQISGQPPSLLAPPEGCHFRPRCPHAFGRCTEKPQLEARTGDSGQLDRCWLGADQKRTLRVVQNGDIGLEAPVAGVSQASTRGEGS